jgi:hypothetical protein
MAERTIPKFHEEKGRVDGYFISAISILIASIILIYGIFGEREDLNEYLFSLQALFLVTAVIAAVVLLFKAGRMVQQDRKAWLGTSQKAEAEIMDRRDGTNENRQDGLPTKWVLGLKPIPAQLEVAPGETVVWVGISGTQYSKYAGKSTLRIIYSTEDPFDFLLEDEIKGNVSDSHH